MENRRRCIRVARGLEVADLVIKGGTLVNVFTGTLEENDIAIVGGIVVGIGDYEGKETIDAKGKVVLPGLIDAHVHVESSLCAPVAYGMGVLKRGTTTVIADPHEIANVAGNEGIRYMLEAGKSSPLDFFFMLPSCVPATPFDHAGAVLTAEDLAPFYRDPSVLGLGEMMNTPGVLLGDDEVEKKLRGAEGKIIDGHGPGLAGKDLAAYLTAGISTDHECTTPEEMAERLARGAYVQIREGSAAKNLEDLIGGVDHKNAHRVLLCTDDRHPGDLLREGHMDYCLRRAVKKGVPAVTAVQMATLNAAQCYGLRDRGGIAPGYVADLVIVDNLTAFGVKEVIKSGKRLRDLAAPSVTPPRALLSSVRLPPVKREDFLLPLKKDVVRVIGLISRSIESREVVRKVDVEGGFFIDNPHLDLLRIGVFERHQGTEKAALALVEGFGLRKGAIASTISHDSHNLVVVGRSKEDMALAVNHLIDLAGGVVVVSEGQVLADLPLPIAGLMSEASMEEVADQVLGIERAARSLGLAEGVDPILSLAFCSLVVIGELKITESGLFRHENFGFVPLEVEGVPSP